MQHSPGLLRSFRNEGRDLKLHRFGPFPLRPWVPMSGWGAELLLAAEDRQTRGACLRVQEASPGVDGSGTFRSLSEGVLCRLEVTCERVARRGTD